VSLTAEAQPSSIRVLVIYSGAAENAVQQMGSNTSAHADSRVTGVNDILENSGLDDVAQVDVAGVIPGLVYDENDPYSGDYAQIAEQISDNAGSITVGGQAGGGKSVDELRTERFADVIVVVMDQTNTGLDGGAAGIGPNPSDFVVVVDVDTFENVWAHEIGHLAGATHEDGYVDIPTGNWPGVTVDAAGNACPPEFLECVYLPVFSKDGGTFQASNQHVYTIGDETHDATGKLEQNLPQLGQFAENAATAAGGAPASPSAVAEFLSCIGHTSQFSVTWWPGSGGGPVGIFEVERLVGSTWFPYYDDYDDMCKLFTASSNTHFRIRGHNAAGTSDWNNFLADAECN